MDGDGSLNYDELLKASVFRKIGAKEERLFRASKKIDVNNDGTITAEELRAALGANSDDRLTRELINEADINHDGVVDYNEFLKMFDQQMEDLENLG